MTSKEEINQATSAHRLEEDSHSDVQIAAIKPLLLIGALSAIAVTLVFMSILAMLVISIWPERTLIQEFARFFDLNGEANVPSWYSSMLWLFSAAFVWLIAMYHRSSSPRFSAQWLGICLICIFLSMDEAAMIHETIGDFISQAFERWEHLRLDGGWLFSWMYWGLGFLGVLAVLYWRFLLELPKNTLALFVASGLLFVSGALGAESLSAWAAHGKISIGSHAAWTFLIATEEGLEMSGILLFIYTLLRYMKDMRIRISFTLN